VTFFAADDNKFIETKITPADKADASMAILVVTTDEKTQLAIASFLDAVYSAARLEAIEKARTPETVPKPETAPKPETTEATETADGWRSADEPETTSEGLDDPETSQEKSPETQDDHAESVELEVEVLKSTEIQQDVAAEKPADAFGDN